MKHSLKNTLTVFVFSLGFVVNLWAQDTINYSTPSAPLEEQTSKDKIYNLVDQQPEFPGGDQGFSLYFHKKFYAGDKAPGRYLFSFVVEKDGKLSNFKMESKGSKQVEEAVFAIFESSPEWMPGKKDGKSVRVKMNFPLMVRGVGE